MTDDFCTAIEILSSKYADLERDDKDGAASKVGRQLLSNAGQHLFNRCYGYLRGKEQTDEQKLAEAMVKNLALDLGKAAIALLEAAQQLKRAGLGYEAGEAYNAHCAARDAATGILGKHLEAEDVDGLVAIEP